MNEIREKLVALSQDMSGCLRERLEQIIVEFDSKIEDAHFQAIDDANRRDAYGEN